MSRTRTRRPLTLSAELLEGREVPAVIAVTTDQDTLNPSDGFVSLREAITAINAGADQPGIVADVSAGGYGVNDKITFTLAAGSTILLNSGGPPLGALPAINKSLVVQGVNDAGGNAALTVDGNASVRVFDVQGAALDVTFRDVVIANGLATFSDGGGIRATNTTPAASGGVVRLENVRVEGNTATVSTPPNGRGGGVFLQDTSLTSVDSFFEANVADNGGALTGNVSGAVVRTITSTNDVFSTNEAATFGGGITVPTNFTASFNNAFISANKVTGPGVGGGIHAANGATVTLTSGSVQNNSAGSSGGGYGGAASSTLTSTLVTFSGNTSSIGAGLYAPGGTVTLQDNVVRNNTASSVGGGLYASGAAGKVTVRSTFFDGNDGGSAGGGGYIFDADAEIFNSAFFSNKAGEGGGLAYFSSAGTGGLLVSNTTFGENTATTKGGGVYVNKFGTGGAVLLDDVTITANTAGTEGGGISSQFSAPATSGAQLVNTVVAANTAPAGTDVSGIISSLGNNLFAVSAGGSGYSSLDLLDVDAKLGPLGGPNGLSFGTPTLLVYYPLAGSPLIGSGSLNGVLITNDQRGKARPSNGEIDIGAVQLQRPTAAADAYTATAGQTLTVPAPGVLTNDTRNDSYRPLTAVLISQPAAGQGTVTLNADGSFTYNPNGFVGTTTFTYAATDGVTVSAATTVTITVNAAAALTAVGDTFTLPAGTTQTFTAANILANDTFGGNPNVRLLLSTLNFSPFPPPQPFPTLTDNGDGSFTVSSVSGYPGATATFEYFLQDPVTGLTSNRALITVTITPVAAPTATPPVANNDAFTVAAGATRVLAVSSLTANDTDVGAAPTIALVGSLTPAEAGTLTQNADGSLTFVSNANFSGTATFQYTVTNAETGLTSGVATVTLNVTAVTRLYAVGAGAGGGPRVVVYNPDRSERFDFFAFAEDFRGGVRVAVGDVNGDGVDDVVAGSGVGGGPEIRAFSGVDGSLITSFGAYADDLRTGLHLAVGDVDGDGIGDIITGVGSGGGPNVRVFQGGTFRQIASFFAYDSQFRGGVRVAAADLNGDGFAEIVTVAGPSGGPQVNVYDGATVKAGGLPERPAPASSFFGFDASYRGGAFVSIAYADGRPFIVVSSDSFPDFAGTTLETDAAVLVDTEGRLGQLTAANTSQPAGDFIPTVYLFDSLRLPLISAGQLGASIELPILTGAVNSGARVSGGTLNGEDGVFVGTGPLAGGRVRFYPLGGTGAPSLDQQVFVDPELGIIDSLTSVFVGANTSGPGA